MAFFALGMRENMEYSFRMDGDPRTYFTDMKNSKATRNYFVAEGWNLAERVFASGIEVLAAIAVPSAEARAIALAAGRCPVTVVDETEISSLAGFKFHRGIMCAAKKPHIPGIETFVFAALKMRRVVILPHLTENENLGAIIRTAACFGIPLLLGPKTGDPFSRLCLRSSMGGCLKTSVYRYENDKEAIDATKASGFDLVGTVLAPEAVPLVSFAWPSKSAIVFGNEHEGLAEPWLSGIGHKIAIPMAKGMDSLNVAVAAGIVIHDSISPPDGKERPDK